MSLQEAIQINNQTIYLLENKLFNDATMCSCAALEILQQYQRVAAQALPNQQRDTDYSIDQFMVNHDLDRTKSSDHSTMDEFIYEHGIVLPTDIMDSTVTILVLIFNCALCHQLLARHCNDGSASCNFLERAKGLYKLAYDQQDADESVIFKFAVR